MCEQIEETPKCPQCNSNNNVKLHGWNESHDRRNYFCKSCKRKFVYPKLPKAERKQYVREPTKKLPVFDFAKIKAKHDKHVNIDSIVDLPCFCADCQKTCDNPETCESLTRWCNDYN